MNKNKYSKLNEKQLEIKIKLCNDAIKVSQKIIDEEQKDRQLLQDALDDLRINRPFNKDLGDEIEEEEDYEK